MRSEHDLYGWQARATKRVVKSLRDARRDGNAKGVLILVDMGQGKTAVSLTAIVDAMDDFIADSVLVIAPIKICEDVWRQEAKQWAHTRHLTFSLVRGNPSDRAFAIARRANVYLINPEHLDWLYKHLRGDFNRFQMVFVDESSLFKNQRSKRFKIVKKIRDKHDKLAFVPMTGTPMPNSIMDLWTQVYMVDGGERLCDTFGAFRSRFFKPGRKLADHVYEWSPDEGAFQKIKELIADITLELSDEDKKKFPVVAVDHWINLPSAIRDKYDELESEMVFEWDNSVIIPKHGGAKSILLRQMASGAVYKNRLLSEDYHELHTEKLDYLAELLEELNRPVLIAYQFKHDLARLRRLLGDDCTVFGEGDTSKNREAWNSGHIKNLLLHPSNAAHGLNLQHGGNHVIWFSEIWSQERHDQLVARLARNGQRELQVFSHYIRARDTVEVLMQIARQLKGDEQDRFRKALRIYQSQKGLL